MAYWVKDKNGDECIFEEYPFRNEGGGFWFCNYSNKVYVNRDSYEILTGKELTWNDNPIEI